MTPDDSAPVDPEVLTDPTGEDQDGDDREGPSSRALVPSSPRGLVPSDPFRRYLAELRRYPPLTREERRSIVLHRAIAQYLIDDPVRVGSDQQADSFE